MDAELTELLELTCMDAIRGDPPGPGVAARLERDITALLRSRGITGFRVTAQSSKTGTFVELLLPTPKRTVERVVLNLGMR